MANTFTQIHIQAIFAVKKRTGLIQRGWKDELYKYITGIIQMHHHKLLAINGMPDHIHICFGMRPDQAISYLMQDIKGHSSKWINENKFIRDRFEWQEGYGAFSYSRSQISSVIKYIEQQELHHNKTNFVEEYIQFLDLFEVEYDKRYILKMPI